MALPATFQSQGCGRKSFQLDARFNELLKGLEGLGLEAKSKYHSGFEAEEVPLDDSRYEELKPYRELDAGRIKTAGKGQWRCEEFLSDFLYMPFLSLGFAMEWEASSRELSKR